MLIALALAVATPAANEVAIPQGEALAAALTARDAEFFSLVFDGCDPERLAAMLTPDFEMYHDRDGVVARSSETFVRQYGEACVARQAPDAWRSRRELVAATLNVHPVPGFGAIEDGEHLFYERHGDEPEHLAGRARFTQLWQLTPDGWRLARVFSYGHRAAE
jgi:hypothetical protein